jgi:hypothetical protein
MAQRVRVTHPRTEAARRGAVRPPSREIDEQTALGELYMTSLIRTQRRLAVIVCSAVAVLLVGIALLPVIVPRWTQLRFAGISLPWLVLGIGVYPGLVALGVYAVRQAERNERAFTELVRRP